MKTLRTMAGLFTSTLIMISNSAAAQTRGGFEIGTEVFDYSYREHVDGETIVYDDGAFVGVDLNYVETIGGGLFLRSKLSAAVGSVDYRSPSTTGDERLDNVTQSVGQLELHLGMDVPIGRGATVSPFTGLASRALIDESGGRLTASGQSGYDREIGYAYIPLGATLRLASGRNAFMFHAQYNIVLDGNSESKFSDLDPAFPDVNVNLNGGHGFELGAAYQVPIGRHALSFGTYLRRWDLKRSESFDVANPDDPSEVIEFFEPANRTTELGLRLLFAF